MQLCQNVLSEILLNVKHNLFKGNDTLEREATLSNVLSDILLNIKQNLFKGNGYTCKGCNCQNFLTSFKKVYSKRMNLLPVGQILSF